MNVEKLNYIKNFLKGQALKCNKELALMQYNYYAAIEFLKEKFGNNEIIVRLHANTHLIPTHVKSPPNLVELRQLHGASDIQIISHTTAVIELNNYEGLLFALLVKLIHDENFLDLNRSAKGTDSWNFSKTKFLEFLKNEIKTGEKCTYSK